MNKNNCKHGTATIVDVWTEIDDDPSRMSPQLITYVKYECIDCGKIWVESAPLYQRDWL